MNAEECRRLARLCRARASRIVETTLKRELEELAAEWDRRAALQTPEGRSSDPDASEDDGPDRGRTPSPGPDSIPGSARRRLR
jgi:hypothetical protein